MGRALLAGILQTQGRLTDVMASVSYGQWPFALHQPVQRDALHIFHDEDVEVAAVAELLGIMGADNVFVVETGGRSDLAQEARQRVGAVQLRLVDTLHRNVSL